MQVILKIIMRYGHIVKNVSALPWKYVNMRAEGMKNFVYVHIEGVKYKNSFFMDMASIFLGICPNFVSCHRYR